MYSGITGQEFAADIYFGVVYYQRLRHMVLDKFQVRTTGPVDPVTRQPVKVRFDFVLLPLYLLPVLPSHVLCLSYRAPSTVLRFPRLFAILSSPSQRRRVAYCYH